MRISSAGKAPAIAATHVVALYDPSSGRIAHLHRVVVFVGGKMVTGQEAEEEAKEEARQHGHPVDKLHLLRTDHLPEAGHWRVDVARRVLIAAPRPERAGRST